MHTFDKFTEKIYNVRVGERYRINIFNPVTGFIHVASVTEVLEGSQIKVKDQLTGATCVGNIRGKHLPDRSSPEAKEYFAELRKIAGVEPNP